VPPRLTPPESQLLRQVLQWLALKGVLHWRANSGGGLRRGRGGRTVPVVGNPEGTPDIICILPPFGRLVGIEVKAQGGKLRPAQEAWAANARRAGALVLCVRSIEDLVEAMRKEGVT
jgi:hypothetical protein